MFEGKFNMILDNDEKILWCGDINVSASIKSIFLKTFLFGLFPPFSILMLGVPYSIVLLILSLLNIIPLWIGIIHFIFSIFACLIFLFLLRKSAKNTFCCITNKRVIKRSGTFNNKFVHYALKNIGNVEVSGGLFDSKNDNPSADFIITVKDYHIDSNNTPHSKKLIINSLNKSYEAYKFLTDLIEGYNEVFRVKHEQ